MARSVITHNRMPVHLEENWNIQVIPDGPHKILLIQDERGQEIRRIRVETLGQEGVDLRPKHGDRRTLPPVFDIQIHDSYTYNDLMKRWISKQKPKEPRDPLQDLPPTGTRRHSIRIKPWPNTPSKNKKSKTNSRRRGRPPRA